jgi:glucose/arabinose dehydrogenase
MRSFFLLIIAILIIAGISFFFRDTLVSFFFKPTETGLPKIIENITPAIEPEIVEMNLNIPWDIVFLPDESLLVTERSGSLVYIDRSGNKAKVAIPEVKATGEGGLLGITLHPNFKENSFIYIYHTAESRSKLINRVVRYTYKNKILDNPLTIIDDIPGARNHDGGRIAFGPDEFLYITTGDAGDAQNAQNIDSLAGKILRLKDDGSIPDDNPFDNPIYSYGHRNPQGLAWDDEGNLWSTEHGRSGTLSGLDELNKINKGGNYGWPDSEGDTVIKGTMGPILHSGQNVTWAPASLAFVNGHFLWGGLRGEALYDTKRTENGIELVAAHFYLELGRIRAVTLGPDGYIYFTSSNTDGRGKARRDDDKIYRIHSDELY